MSAGEESRESAEDFGRATEDAFERAGDALDALRGKGDQPEEPDDDRAGGDINININR